MKPPVSSVGHRGWYRPDPWTSRRGTWTGRKDLPSPEGSLSSSIRTRLYTIDVCIQTLYMYAHRTDVVCVVHTGGLRVTCSAYVWSVYVPCTAL